MKNSTLPILILQKRLKKSYVVLLWTILSVGTVHADPPNCKDMADKVVKKFEAEKKMVGLSHAKCTAISLVISDLTDLAAACTQKPGDEKFLAETYTPLAKAIGDEAPKACER